MLPKRIIPFGRCRMRFNRKHLFYRKNPVLRLPKRTAERMKYIPFPLYNSVLAVL